MVAAPFAGVISGEIFDKKYPEVSESSTQVAKDYFEFFSKIINSVKDEVDFSDFNQAWA